MNKRTYFLGFGIVLLTFSLWACEGPAGPMGPQGAQGEQGQLGDKGDQGNQGDQGPEGTANVIYSEWTAFDTGNWTLVTEFGRQTQLYEVVEKQITDEILNTGLVYVYIKFGGAPQPRPLPFIGYVTSTTVEQILWYRLVVGKLVIVFHNVGDTLNPGTFGSGNQYRYIIIPGGVPAKIKSLDFKNYDAVVKYFGINP